MKYFFFLVLFFSSVFSSVAQQVYVVAANGGDQNNGSVANPLKTLEAAIAKAGSAKGKDVHIELRGGTYRLQQTLTISARETGFKSLIIKPYASEKVFLTGSQQLRLTWQPYKAGIYKAQYKTAEAPDQLFVNGKALSMARYPNYDSSARVYHGTAADAISAARVGSWQHPEAGFIHALHQGEWGDFHYRITGKNDTALVYEGGWQNNRPAPMHKEHRLVENIFEELDAPGEWYFDKASATLYCYPPKGINLNKAEVAASALTDLIHISGSVANPVKNITITGINFTQTARSFMQVKEPLLRSDWCIYRGGAILLDGTENITISNCNFYELGGNAIFHSNYNLHDTIRGNHIYNIGANAIAYVGSADAVRSPAFRYENFVPWQEMDFEKGPKTNEYPQYCVAEGNLIHNIGNIEKQVAGVEISMAFHIGVTHNSIYEVPRAGINISEGTWGGHVIEFNDVFNTVLESGDHGAFNSWGRDRYWRPERNIIDSIVAARPGIELLDVIDPIIIRNNRFQCDHGWDIDLDDGSTNYQIYNNVCLNGGLKLREGYHRTVTNNILINNSFHPHVWLQNSHDVFMHNIVTAPYAPIMINDWGNKVDSNFFLSEDALQKSRTLGIDKNSMYGNAMFVNAAMGNYTVKQSSPASKMDYRNFDITVGVTSPWLKKLAKKPVIKPLFTSLGETKGQQMEWMGASFKNIETLGEKSAAGLHDNNGALLVKLNETSIAAKGGLQTGDVIIKLGDHEIKSIADLLQTYQAIKWMGGADISIVRNQGVVKTHLSFK